MRMHKVCYCEFGFLKEFFSSRPILTEPTEENVHLLWTWVSLYKYLCKSELILDISSTYFTQLIDSYKDKSVDNKNNGEIALLDVDFRSWLKLINKSEGLLSFTETNDRFPHISEFNQVELDEQKLNAVYLTTSDDDSCKKHARLTGVIILNNNLAKQCAHLFMDNGHAVPSEDAIDWGVLKKIKYPSLNICNSIIIIDNYLFVDDKDKGNITCEWPDKLKKNLRPIIQALLPEMLDDKIVFEIAVFTAQEKEKDWKGFESQYNYIKTLLSEKKINYRINFYGKCHDAFHDRCILTNNVLISSGRGFGIFTKNKETSKPTTINITFPFIQSNLLWCDGSFLNVLSKAKGITDRLIEKDNYWGDDKRENRIISFYTNNNNITKEPTQNIYSSIKPGMIIDLSKIKNYSKGRKYNYK